MTLILTSGEGEGAAFSRPLNTTDADVNKRGAISIDMRLEGGIHTRKTFDSDLDVVSISQTIRRHSDYTNSAQGKVTFFEVRDADNNVLINVRIDYTGGLWSPAVSTYDETTGAWTDDYMQANGVNASSTIPQRYDLTVSHDAVNDEIEWNLKLGGATALAGKFDKTLADVGLPRTVMFGTPECPYSTSTSNRTTLYLYNIIVDDEATVGVDLVTLAGTSGGYHSDGDGNYTAVSEEGVDLTGGISFDTAGDKKSWFVTPLAGKNLTGVAVGGLVFTFLASVDSAAAVNGVQPFVRVGGVDYNLGGPIPVYPEMLSYTVEAPDNPATTAAWTGTEVAAGIEFGIEAVNIP